MKTTLILSGGLDSTTLLYNLTHVNHEVHCVTFDYGQRHGEKEIACASSIAHTLGCPWTIIDLHSLTLHIASTLTTDSPNIPEGHYADHSMRQTVVPNRNMIMLSVAVGYAITHKCENVAYAAHHGDHDIYPDCRPQFASCFQHAVTTGNYEKVVLLTPFIHKTKDEIVRIGARLEVPFANTWSCYRGHRLACGRCGTCVERLEAFSKAEIEDPLEYEDREFWKACVLRRDGRTKE